MNSFRHAGLLALCALLAGCGSLIPTISVERQHFVLNDLAASPQKAAEQTAYRLLVRDTISNTFINSHKIIYSDDPQLYRFYSLARWVERPTDRFTSLLSWRLARSDGFASVSHLAGAALGDVQLNTELAEFYHDVTDPPGKARILLAAELIDLRKRVVLGQKQFTATVAVKSYDARGAVTGLSEATTEVLGKVVEWSISLAKQHEASAPPAAP